MGPYDLYSDAYRLKSASFRLSKYYNDSELINNTRACHNELLINRNLSDGTKRQPSYILCFDTINNESKKASEQFGIPIVFVDTNKHIQIKLQELETLKQSFKISPSIEIAKKIINIQETLRCGFISNNEKLANQIFNESYITDNILFLINNCKNYEMLINIENLINKEINRFLDYKDNRIIPFNENNELIQTALDKKKKILDNSLQEYNEKRKKYQVYESQYLQFFVKLWYIVLIINICVCKYTTHMCSYRTYIC